jgi:mycothiol synthase
MAFLDAIGEEWGTEPVGERKVIGLLHRPAGIVAEDEDGSLIGVAPFVESGGWRTFEVVTRSSDVATTLIGDMVAAHPERLRVWALHRRYADEIEAAGFSLERSLDRMARPLPVDEAVAEVLEVRGYRPGDEYAWVEVNNRAFAGHPEQGGLGVEDFAERTELPWWEPDDLRLGFREGVLVGFCWTKRHPDGSGEIYAIAVDPTTKGRGWGRDLLLAGLHHLGEVGCETATLYVDAANEAAVALYSGMGFRATHADAAFTR